MVVFVYVSAIKILVASKGQKAGASLSSVVSFVPCYFTWSFTATSDWGKDKKNSIILVSENTLLFETATSFLEFACWSPQTNFSHVATLSPLNHVPKGRGREVKAVIADTGTGRDEHGMSRWPTSLFSQTHCD